MVDFRLSFWEIELCFSNKAKYRIGLLKYTKIIGRLQWSCRPIE
jgi:hypothetical protein